MKQFLAKANQQDIFSSLLGFSWISLVIFAPLSALVGAYFTAICLGLAALTLLPVAWLLNKSQQFTVARYLYLFTCSFCIFSGSIVTNHGSGAEYYYLPATMLALMVFSFEQRRHVFIGSLFPVMFWISEHLFFENHLPASWLLPLKYSNIIVPLNFILACMISLVHLLVYSFNLKQEYAHHLAEKDAAKAQLKIALAQAETSRLRLEEAQHVAKIGSWTQWSESNEGEWSPEMFRILNRNPALGVLNVAEYENLIHPEDREKLRQAMRKLATLQIPMNERYRLKVGESYIWLQSTAAAASDLDRGARIFGTCQDISHEMMLRQALEKERAKSIHNSKLASLGEFSASVAHEINNPLAIIMGAATIIAKSPQEVSRVIEKAEIIRKSGQRISVIVAGLQKFARSNEKKEIKPHTLVRVIEEVLPLIDARAKRHNVEIISDIRDSGQVLCNDVEMEQVLVNLLNNAIYAVKSLAQKWIKISLFDNGEEVILQITDSGTGIPLSIGDKLFEPFFTTKEVGEGTGLGLSIVKGILDEHQATIQILEDVANTCFEIRFRKAELALSA